TERCNFAWLEKPQVGGSGGKLLIRARFTGRTSVDVFGRCIGLGDSFPLSITATPFYAAGQIGLKNVTAVPDGGGGFYAAGVGSALASSLEKGVRFPLGAEAKRRLEDPGALAEYPRQLRRFD